MVQNLIPLFHFFKKDKYKNFPCKDRQSGNSQYLPTANMCQSGNGQSVSGTFLFLFFPLKE
jgi:hypothetical protein